MRPLMIRLGAFSMTDTTSIGEDPDRFEQAVDLLGAMIDTAIANECARHYSARTQEHQLTSRLGKAIETVLEHHPIEGFEVQIHTQDFPDRGPGALEKQAGADLYIALVREGEEDTVSKGILVQSKWDRALRVASERRKLREQAERMQRASRDGSYIWVYEPTGIAAYPASAATGPTLALPPFGGQTVGELIADGLRCEAGDRDIGRDTDKPLVDSLNEALERVHAKSALSIVMRPETDAD